MWSFDIPPSQFLFIWRLMHVEIPTDENLALRGCRLPSRCYLCLNNVEDSFHLFFQCSFAMKLWSWFAHSVNMVLHFNSIEDIWQFCDRSWSPQCHIVIKAVLINLLNTIWFARNQARFSNKSLT
jgi:hypothetical protein